MPIISNQFLFSIKIKRPDNNETHQNDGLETSTSHAYMLMAYSIYSPSPTHLGWFYARMGGKRASVLDSHNRNPYYNW